MTDFETVLLVMIIPIYGVLWYIAGRMNLLDRLINMLEEKAKEITDYPNSDEK